MSVIHPWTYSSAPVKECVGVQFAVLNPDEIKRGSVCKVDSSETFVRGLPKMGGLQDPRTGTCEFGAKCLSCHQNKNECPGHLSYIELAKPMFHIGYLPVVLRVLKCVCFSCSKLLVDERDEKFRQALKVSNPQARLRTITKLCEGKSKCEGSELDKDKEEDGWDEVLGSRKGHNGCGELQPRIRKELGTFRLWAEWKHSNLDDKGLEKKQLVTAQQVHNILKNISEEDIIAMGFNPAHSRPEWMILTVFPVCPPPVRPAVLMGANQRCDDDLTHKLKDIVKANLQLQKQEQSGAPQHIINDFAALLQFHCATLVNNELSGMPKATVKSGRPIKSIRERLKSKAGRVRQNLMGKRVDFSARTVITADPNLELDQVGVPVSMAKILTFPDRVTTFNIDKMYELVRRGPENWPGARFFIRDDGQRVNLQFVKKTSDIHLEPGYIVERHINDGDVVLFNRQPTLHRMSMMGHRVRVLPFSTFRLNLSVTTPYNADFDGDEMNLHVPQSLLSKAELIHMMIVPKNIITPQASRPCMGIVQDSLLGCNRLTKRDTFLDCPTMMNMLMHVPNFERVPVPAILKAPGSGPLWTGKQLFSEIIPPVNRSGTSNEHPDKENDANLSVMDTKCLIKQGVLIMGIHDKKAVGNGAGSLVHIIWNEYGPERCKWFLTNVQRVVNHWLLTTSFSVGCGDTIADEGTVVQITDIIDKCKMDVKKILKQAQEGGLKIQPGKTVQETFEKDVNAVLNKAREDAGKTALNSLRRSNRFKIMVAAGSKGSPLNISQIAACVGQQNVEGKRIPFGFRRRTLPHFTQDDHGPESRGFVENCYLRGLTPQEMFFHAMGGREGLIDTAVKTSETGYIQRKLIKALEDIKAEYDGTVRDATGRVIQWVYGEDGMDGMRLEEQRFELLKMSNKDMKNKFWYPSPDNTDFGERWMERTVKDDFLEHPEKYKDLEEEYQQLIEDRKYLREWAMLDGEDRRPIPVNLDRLIENAKTFFAISPHNISDIHPCQVVASLRQLEKDLLVVRSEHGKERQECATRLFNVFLRSRLASKRVLKEYKLDAQAFNWLLGEIKLKFESAQINPGEMVGSIAAQSCGEPATQMTLNTFHFAGVSSKNVTLGVPRLRELINIAKRPKQQGLNVFLSPTVNNDMEKTKRVLTRIEFATLRHVTSLVEIVYDPDPAHTVVPEDEAIVQIFFDMDLLTDEERVDMHKKMAIMSPWVMRLEFENQTMFDKEIEMAEIQQRLKEKFCGDLWIEVSDDNAEKLVMRIRIMNPRSSEEEDDQSKEDDIIDTLKQVEQEILDNIALRGVPGIKKCTMKKIKTTVYDPETGEARKEEPWALETDGSNLLAVLACEDVDDRQTICNSICEITTVLGIEAVRNALYKEIKFVYDVYGIGIGYRHYSVLCDAMTNKGYLMAISRHGINRGHAGPLMRCSYEETVEILFQAAAFGERDHMKGVSANIIMGRQIKGGTGQFDLLLDQEMLVRENAQSMSKGGLLTGVLDKSSPASVYSGVGGLSPGTVVGGGFTPFAPSIGGVSPGISPYIQSSPAVNFSPLVQSGGVEEGYSPSGISPSFSPASPSGQSPAGPSPAGTYSPLSPSYSPMSPAYTPASPGGLGGHTPSFSPKSPSYSPASPSYSPRIPASVGAPAGESPGLHSYSAGSGYSPYSPAGSAGSDKGKSPSYSPVSPSYLPSPKSDYSSTASSSGLGQSPIYSPVTPAYSPASPSYSPTNASERTLSTVSESMTWSPSLQGSPGSSYSPTSPNLVSTSPAYSPESPAYTPKSPASPASAMYSPASPAYSPASPNTPMQQSVSPAYSAASPAYSPASPAYSPASPAYSPASPAYSPTSPSSPAYTSSVSPAYSPASPAYSPASPAYSPASPAYSPASPAYSPASPAYSPASPAYSQDTTQRASSSRFQTVGASGSSAAGRYSPASPQYSPSSPSPSHRASTSGVTYSPASPQYSPTHSPAAPSPAYSPAHPEYSPRSPNYSPASPVYDPSKPTQSSTSATSASVKTQPASSRSLLGSGVSSSGSSITYSPASPAYSPSSPVYSPAHIPADSSSGSAGPSPSYSPASPSYSPASPAYSPASPNYSPSSPAPSSSDAATKKEPKPL